MNIALASIVHEPDASPVVRVFTELTAQVGGPWRLTRDYAGADMILFVDLHLSKDPSLKAFLGHPLVRQYPHKVLVYNETSQPWCVWPGVYVSMPQAAFDPQRQRAFGYYKSNSRTISDPATPTDLLFCFIGTPGHVSTKGHKVRQNILRLSHPRAILEDSSGFVFFDDKGDPASHRRRQIRFTNVMARSKFVLCPRGMATSSIRMYETLRAGRVPVVLADGWVPPRGPAWDKCTLTLPQRDVSQAVALMEENEHRWPEMAREARQAYEQYFSPEVAVGRIYSLCGELLNNPASAQHPWRRAGYAGMRYRGVKTRARRYAGKTLRLAGLK